MEKKPWVFPVRNMDDGNHPLGSGMPSDVGKAASALLAKHVRTLEVLFSLQRENAKLKQEGQAKPTDDETRKRIAEAVKLAVAGPNELVQELQSQIEKLRQQVGRLEQDLSSAKDASAKVLKQVNSEIEDLREANQHLRTKCSDLEFEAGRFACQASQQGELESKLRVTAATAAEEEQRANDLHQKLTETEAISSTLRLSLEEREKRLSFLETADAGLRSSISEHKNREAALKVRVSELQQRMRVAESEREMLDKRLRDAFREGERVRKEMANRAGVEQALREEVAKQTARADANRDQLGEERKRLQRLREEGKRQLEEEARKLSEALTQHARERDGFIARIDNLSREVFELRGQLDNNKSQFGKYVEAKTENTQLKEELDALREMIAVRRGVLRGVRGDNVGFAGGPDGGKGMGADRRLRHSAGIARNKSTGSTASSPGQQAPPCAWSRRLGDTSTMTAQPRRSSVDSARTRGGTGVALGTGGVKDRRHSMGVAETCDWTAACVSQVPGELSMAPTGSSRESDRATGWQRGVRAQQVF